MPSLSMAFSKSATAADASTMPPGSRRHCSATIRKRRPAHVYCLFGQRTASKQVAMFLERSRWLLHSNVVSVAGRLHLPCSRSVPHLFHSILTIAVVRPPPVAVASSALDSNSGVPVVAIRGLHERPPAAENCFATGTHLAKPLEIAPAYC